jgi:drug/metabolite transporter (DMT)-like permease
VTVRRQPPAWVAHAAVVVAAIIFGSTFVVVKDAIKHVQPVPFLAVRFLIGAAALLVVDRVRLWVARRGRGNGAGAASSGSGGRSGGSVAGSGGRWGLVRTGFLAGSVLLGGYVFQTVGLQYTTTSVSAFVTYLLVVLVPILSAVVLRHLPTPPTMAGVALATAGLFLLTGKGVALGRGELLTLGCALCFAIHILVLSDGAPRHDSLRLNAIQLAVVGGACLIPGLFLGGYRFALAAWVAAAYTGLLASAIALGLQIWGQRLVGPTRTSLLLMIEPVSAAVIGVAIGEHLGWGGVAGAAMILAGIAASEVGPLLLPSRPARLSAARD